MSKLQRKNGRPQQEQPAWPRTHLLAAAVALTLLAFWLRLHDLGGDSFWVDELLTLETARRGLAAALGGARDHPPLMYVLNAGVLRGLGETEFSARLVSLAAGTLAIPCLLLLGRIVRREGAGTLAALLLALAPVHIRHTQEARHYALLLVVALAATCALLLAMQRPRPGRWLAYALLSALALYTHYAALLVLATHAVIVGVWLAGLAWQEREAGRMPAVREGFLLAVGAAVLVLLLFLPQAPRFLESLSASIGAELHSDTGVMVPLGEWLAEIYRAFGMYDARWAPLLLAAAVTGLLLLLWQRDRWTLLVIVSSMAIPLLVILAGQVARGAFPRYVIFILPYYLLAAALVPAWALAWVRGQAGRRAATTLAAVGAALLILAARPAIAREYAHTENDWRGVARYLAAEAEDGDVLAMMTMNFPNGFNIVSVTLPYHLNRQGEPDLQRLNSGRLRAESVAGMETAGGALWAVVFDYRNPPQLLAGEEPPRLNFPTHVSVLRPPVLEGETALARLIRLYEGILPTVMAPAPQCLYMKDLALLTLEAGEPGTAASWLEEAAAACPELLNGDLVRYDEARDLFAAVYEAAIAAAAARGDTKEARRLARLLLAEHPRSQAALEALAVANLLRVFEEGEAQVEDGQALEPVESDEWLMPGEPGPSPVLFMHPPASAAFTLALPEEPVALRTRIGLFPLSWEWGGDGSTFVVTVTDEAGRTKQLLAQQVGNAPEERRWHDVRVSLTPYAGQTITLTLATTPGPAADFTGDWAGWEAPRVVRE